MKLMLNSSSVQAFVGDKIMNLILACILSLAYSSILSHQVFCEKYEQNSNIQISSRKRRNVSGRAKMTVINKSRSIISVYFMDTRYHRREYFADMRRNEQIIIESFIGTTWLAYDGDQKPLLLNKKYNYLVLPQYAGREFDIIVSDKNSSSTEARLQNLPFVSQKHVQILVMTDYTWTKKHQSHGVDYVKALMNTVNHIFADKSLNVSLHVTVTKLVMLHDRTVFNISDNNPRASLQSTCNYAYDLQKEKNLVFDFVVTLTRTKFGYSGFTPLYRMCVPYKSCTLVYDSGMQSAFIIAHEIGHSIGLAHDGDHNNCGESGPRGSIMSATVYSKFNNYHWSLCSKIQIKENINYFQCLNNKPRRHEPLDKKRPPGSVFDIDNQCKIHLDRNYTACLNLRSPDEYCRFLFCRSPKNKRGTCLFWTLPPLDGTTCAENRWCIQGKCIPYGLFGPLPINGSWSEWKPWGRCSTRCGQGVRFRQRSCDNPKPEFGGSVCNGTRQEWKICYSEPCNINRTFADIRHDSCYNLAGPGWRWINKRDMETQVKKLNLNCTFENGLCDWHHNATSPFKFRFGSGKTSTENTGPTDDHTYGNKSGKYIYMESSHPLRSGDSMDLLSSVITTPLVCLQFSYHMHGERLGHMKVTALPTNENEKELWRRSGSQGESWITTKITIEQNKPYMIKFSAVRGSTYLNDMALDDIFITAGACRKDELKTCHYTCFNNSSGESKTQRVSDGQQCNEASTNLCVLGVCQVIGCDGLRGSYKDFDKCGVCGGDETTCELHTGLLQVKPEKVTMTVLKLPAGSSNIVVRKETSTVGKIGVMHVPSRRLYYYDDVSTDLYPWYYFQLVNTTFRYQTMKENKTDIIYCEGFLDDDVLLKLVFPDSNFGNNLLINISYSLSLPRKLNRETYFWKVTWTKCSKQCGGGKMSSMFDCVDFKNGKRVNSSYCQQKGVRMLPQEKTCNTQACKISYAYKPGQWSACLPCGVVGKRHRNVTCIKEHEIDGIEIERNLTKCNDLSLPSLKISCYVYCPKKPRRCVERSNVCPMMLKKGYCKYSSVKLLCCKTCK